MAVDVREIPTMLGFLKKEKPLPTLGKYELHSSIPFSNTPEKIIMVLEENPKIRGNSVSKVIEKCIKSVEEYEDQDRMSSRYASVKSSQYRAIDYIYGKGVQKENESEFGNPLVDILSLITYPKYFGRNYDFIPAVKGKAYPEPILPFLGAKGSKKAEQFRIEQTPRGNISFRTITNFMDHLPTTIRGLYVMAEVSKHHPAIIKNTFKQYLQNFSETKSNQCDIAVGILEILKNARLLYDPRFYSFSTQLRKIVFEEGKFKDYRTLKKKYSYSIINNKHFWYQGEVNYHRSHEPTKYVGTSYIEGVKENLTTYRFPLFRDLQVVSRSRAELIRNIKNLTNVNSLKNTALNFTPEKAIAEIKKDRISKAEFTEEKNVMEQKQYDTLRRNWRNFVENEIDENIIIESDEIKIVTKAIQIIAKYFEKDQSLSQKSRTNFLKVLQSGSGDFYRIKTEKLINDPIFKWILDLFNSDTRESFSQSVIKNNENTEAFHQLMRLMIYETAKISFQTKENDFIFDPNYKQKLTNEQIHECLEKIIDLVSGYIPDTTQLTKTVLAEHDTKIYDLLSTLKLFEIKDNLENMTYHHFLNLRFKKSKRFSEEDKKFLFKLGKNVGLASLVTVFSLGLFYGIVKLIDLIDKSKLNLPKTAETSPAKNKINNETASKIGDFLAKIFGGLSTSSSSSSALETSVNSDNPGSLTSGFPSEIADRLPDAIKANKLKDLLNDSGFFVYGRIYQLPENMSQEQGSSVGFFPFDEQLKVYQKLNPKYYNTGLVYQEPLNNTVVVDYINDYLGTNESDFRSKLDKNDLVYYILDPRYVNYPPIGFRIKNIIQQGGTIPLEGVNGEIDYSQGDLPNEILVVAEPIIAELPKINVLHSNYPYTIRQFFPLEETLDRSLNKSPELQKLYKDFVTELNTVSLTGSTEEIQENQSDVVTKYASLYEQYTNSNRYYALDYQIDKSQRAEFANPNAQGFVALESISDSPDKGYFCAVASYAFRDFMASAGVYVTAQPGITLYNIQGGLLGTIAHQNNLILLPNGKVLNIDVTPPVTNKTPKEDLDALSGNQLDPEKYKKLVEEQVKKVNEENNKQAKTDEILAIVGNISLVTSVSALGIAAAYMGIRSTKDFVQGKIIKKRIIDSFRLNSNLTKKEKELVASSAGHLALSTYDSNFPKNASNILNLLQNYNSEIHDKSIDWLIDEGAMILASKNSQEAFKDLCNSVKEGSSDYIENVRRSFPSSVYSDIERFNRGVKRVGLPYDFDESFGLARLVSAKDFINLAKKVYKNIGVEGLKEDKISAPYKIEDVLNILSDKYASKQTPNEVKPIFNTVYRMLGGRPISRKSLVKYN